MPLCDGSNPIKKKKEKKEKKKRPGMVMITILLKVNKKH